MMQMDPLEWKPAGMGRMDAMDERGNRFSLVPYAAGLFKVYANGLFIGALPRDLALALAEEARRDA